jgi:acetyl esterase/lipase
MTRAFAAIAVILCGVPGTTAAQPRVERNVVYGIYSGLAFLMDVHRPAEPNGIAIIAIQGSAWYAPMRYDAAQLKAHREVSAHAERFATAGYTVFAINHRSAPRFRFPAQIEDAQRAVRFIRFHASEYGIQSDRIGAWGSSSGGHLVELLGTTDGAGEESDSDPVNRLNAKVQCVVALFAPADLPIHFGTSSRARGTLSALMGFAYQDPEFVGPSVRLDDFENRQYRDGSPTTHVTADDAPILLMHGDEDDIVPIQQSEIMESALKQAGVDVKLVRVPGGGHGPRFGFDEGDPHLPDFMGESVRWFDMHLKTGRSTQP